MRRTRAEALAMVNWKGVFYERYLLDEHVTALEGANGAGKTTVMIAAYIVLLPDMTRLRFTNHGESGATGGDRGIYGRLGESHGVSYAAIDFRLGTGARQLAGVHLERRSEPVVELTPFIISGLSDEISLQEVLLDRGEVDAVPELNRLRELAALAGGHLKVFSKTADYFRELFDLNITPLRLVGQDERAKFSEMLRTSMIGGISQALSGGLREFLLRPETGLADTLRGMRRNLDACRKTRLEVERARQMEAEIRGVYDVGHEMFVAALHATRERSDEQYKQVLDAKDDWKEADKRAELLAAELQQVEDEHQSTADELALAGAALEQAAETLSAVQRANEIWSMIEQKEQEREERLRRLREKQGDEERAKESRDHTRQAHKDAQLEHQAAARGLANLQRGLDHLHRRAAAYKRAQSQLVRAQELLVNDIVDVESAPSLRRDYQGQMDDLDAKILKFNIKLSTADGHRQEYERVYAALRALRTDPIPIGRELEVARYTLRALRELDQLVEELEELPARVNEAEQRAKEQAELLRKVAALQSPERVISTSQDVRVELSDVDKALETSRGEREAWAAEESAVEGAIEKKRAELKHLKELLPRWRSLQAKAVSLATKWWQGRALRSKDCLADLQSVLQENYDLARDKERALRVKIDDVSEQIQQLTWSGSTFSEALLNARDCVEGELLAGHFDDVSVEEAGRFEALLGPLVEAIIVDDALHAAQKLAKEPSRPSTVWLIDGQSEIDFLHDGFSEAATSEIDGAVFVASQTGHRLSTISTRPTLGKRARLQRLQDLRQELDLLEEELERAIVEHNQVKEGLQITMELLNESALFEREDPTIGLRDGERNLNKAVQRKEQIEDELRRLGESIRQAERRRNAFLDILPNAHLIDLPDLGEVKEELRERLERAQAAEIDLEQIAQWREILEEELDILRISPPTEEELASFKEQLEDARQVRMHFAQAVEALRYIEENTLALTWSDAPDALTEQRALYPALEKQLNDAQDALEAAQDQMDAAEREYAAALEDVATAKAEVNVVENVLEQSRKDLAEIGVKDASEQALLRAEEHHKSLKFELDKLTTLERTLNAELIRIGERHKAARGQAEQKHEILVGKKEQWHPQVQRWERIKQEAEEAGLLAGVMAAKYLEETQGAGSINLYQRAQSQRELLIERVGRAEGGGELAQAISNLRAETSQRVGMAYLHGWIQTLEWLRQRIPPQIAEVDDPLESLERLRLRLVHLEERLTRQEKDLRGQSEDIARNIKIQRRKAHRDVKQLNRDLRDIRFGSIHGVRIRLKPVESREKVLRALQEGAAQQLLFHSEMPIDEAMAELFKRYGGGSTGGDRLLDYREYIDLQVEVKRQAREEWERAKATQMSTGEAIGVGAAIMMVVLTAWERQARLLRRANSTGTLRFLFLDEANRLSQDNLGVLFELCDNLKLQLLIAAPEVAQAKGNTTYRLIRQLDEQGRETVRVSGRRMAPEAVLDVGY